MVAAIRGTLAPAVLEFDGFVKIGEKEIFDVMSFVCPCDWNEDGLFDLLLGSTKGKIYIAINQGSKTEPKFPGAQPVKGTDTEKDMLAPSNWFGGLARFFWSSYLGGYCNSALLFSAEKEMSLRAGGLPIRPVEGNYFMYFRYIHNYLGWTPTSLSQLPPFGSSAPAVPGARVIAINGRIPLQLKRQYEFTFSSIVEGKPVMWGLWAHELTQNETDDSPGREEYRHVTDMIPPSGAWQKRTYRFKCPNTVQSNLNYNLFFRMPEGDVKFMLDNLSLKEIEPR